MERKQNMFVLLFRKCCHILWNHLSYQQHIIWLFLLVLISQQLQGSDGKTAKWNHSIQRRFMWKQMDSTVDGFVDRVVTGARVMKSMIGEFMPPKQSTANVMDYLPTETTRIRYIIRNPHTKETKVIRVRPSKKVVKLMAMTPKPLLADKSKPMNEPEHILDKLKPMPMKEPGYSTDKYKSIYMMDPDKLRKLEKEQELIAEGRIPIRSETKPIYMAFKAEKPKYIGNYFDADDNIVSGKIQDINESWKPVYKLGDPPAGFTTSKPYMMSALHTSVVGELLPEPQKQVYEPLMSNEFPEEEPKKSNTYEVTEYTAEESIVQPYTHEYYRHETPSVVHAIQKEEPPLRHYTVTTEAPKIKTNIENIRESKTYHNEYRSHRGFLPSRETYILPEDTTTTTQNKSVVQPYTQEHYRHETFPALHAIQKEEPSFRHYAVTAEAPKIITNIENNRESKTYHNEYRSHRGFLPSRETYRLTEETTTTTSAPTTTTTTEEPNYPEIFLKKIRSRPDSSYNFKEQPRIRSPELSLENNWIPSNSTYATERGRQIPFHLTSINSQPRTKSQKWPPVEDSYLNSGPLSAIDTSSTTEVPIVQEFTNQSHAILSNSSSSKNVRLKSPHYSPFTEAKHRNVRHRGSVRYGDKLEIE